MRLASPPSSVGIVPMSWLESVNGDKGHGGVGYKTELLHESAIHHQYKRMT
jgi:hypothetical protein